MDHAGRILVAAGSAAVVRILADPLRAHGHEVLTAATAQETLERARQARPDLLLLDAPLPDGGGLTLCREVKSDRHLADLFVVLVWSDTAHYSDRVRALQAGADDCFSRTMPSEELCARVSTLLRLRRTCAALRDQDERLRLSLEAAHMVTWEWHIENDTLSYSDNADTEAGFNVARHYTHFQAVLEAVHPDDRSAVRAALTGAVNTDALFEVEFRLRLANDQYFWVHSRGRVFRDAQGRAVRMLGVSVDITERKQAEAEIRRLNATLEQRIRERTTQWEAANAALRESEQRYRALFDGASTGILVADIETRAFGFANPAICQMLGYPPEELVQLGVTDIHPPESLPEVLAAFEAQARGEKSAVEVPCRRKDGTVFWAEVTAMPVVINGRPMAVSFFTDITVRRRAEAEVRQLTAKLEQRVRERTAALEAANRTLQENQALLEAQFQNCPDIILVVDRNLRFVTINRALVGPHTAAELVGQDAIAVLPPEERERVRAAILDCFETGRVHDLEHQIGEGRWVRARLAPMRVGGAVTNVMAIATDITERKQAEAALLEREKLYRTLFDLSPSGILLEDAEGTILDANEALCKATGYARSDIVGRNVRLFVPPEFQSEVPDHLAQLLAGRTLEHEVQNVRQDGSRCIMDLRETRITLPDGRPGILVVANDVTARKRAEQELLKAQAQLQHVLRFNPAVVYTSTPTPPHTTTYVSENVRGQTGYEPRQFLENPQFWFRHIHPDDQAAVAARLERLPVEGSCRQEYRFQCRDGTWRWLLDHCTLVRDADGRAIDVVGFAVDVTEHRQTQEQLADALDLNQKMISALPVGVCAYRAEGQCVLANEAIAAIVGATPHQVLEQNFRHLESWRRSGLLRLAEAALAAGQPRQGEIHGVTTFGKEVWLDCRMAPFTSGGQRHLLVLAHDITERKRAEGLLQIQHDLATFLSSTSDLQAALDRLLQTATRLEGVDAGGVYLLDEETGVLTLAAHRGLSPEFVRAVSHYTADTPQAALVRAGHPQYVTLTDPTEPTHRPCIQEGLRSLMIIPIHHDHGPIACLNLASRVRDHIPASSRVVAETLAAEAGGAILRIRAEHFCRENETLLRGFFDSPGAMRGIVELLKDDVLLVSGNSTMAAAYGRTPESMRAHRLSQLGMDRATLDLWLAAYRQCRQEGTAITFEYCDRGRGADWWGLATVCFLGQNRHGREQFGFVVTDISDRKAAEAALRQLPGRILEAQEAERQRVARDLHDGVSQILSSAKFRLHAVESALPARQKEARETVARCRELVGQALDESRRLAQNLRPRVLDDLGLDAACRSLCADLQTRTGIRVQFEAASLVRRLPRHIELHIYRILQEALTNVEKHARATGVRVVMRPRNHALEVRVEDNGQGFDPATARAKVPKRGSLGLANIRERAAALGGTSEITSEPGKGTRVVVRIPVQIPLELVPPSPLTSASS